MFLSYINLLYFAFILFGHDYFTILFISLISLASDTIWYNFILGVFSF